MEATINTSLGSVMQNQDNVRLFRKHLLSIGDDEEVRDALYEVVTCLQKGQKIKETYRQLVTGSVGFNGHVFKEQREKQMEEDEFITNPAEVEEGVHECECGSKKTISFSLQTSAGDESTAVWAQCVECSRKWRA